MTRESCPGPNGEKINTITISAWPCESLCGPITGGAGSLPLTKSPRRIWASVPKTTERGFSSSGRFLEDEKKGGKNTNTTAPRNAESTGAAITHTVGKRSLPTDRWGKQSVWLASSGSRHDFRAEARTHFICRERKCCGAFTHQEKKSRRAAPVPPCVRRLDTGHRWSQQTRMPPLRGPCRRRTRLENGCPKGCHISHFSARFLLSENDSSALGPGCFAGIRGVRI